MKKETLILLALLGFGLYRHFKSKPKQTEKKPDEYYIKGFRKIYDSVNGDASKAIPLGLALFREDESFSRMSEGTLVGVLESFINDFIKNPNYGL